METAMPSVDRETQQIIATYQKIYNLIFRYGIFIVLGVISFGVVLMINPHAYTIYNVDNTFSSSQEELQPLLLSGDTYIAKGITLNPRVPADQINVSILQGFVDVTPEVQMGYGALASYKDIILPISINLAAHDTIFSKEYFSSAYNPEDLNEYVQNTILTYPVRNIQTTLYRYKQETAAENARTSADPMQPELPLTTTLPVDNTQITRHEEPPLISRFGLQCLGNRHITDFFCHKNTEVFVSRIPFLSFENKLEEMRLLMDDIAQTPYKERACNNLLYAFGRTAQTDRARELIFTTCGQQYVSSYRRIADFATVIFELQGISNAKLYTDNDINIFKLLSLQQKIYHNTLQKNYDVGTIEVYLAFVQELLIKRPEIDQIYKDMTYLYNNTYLRDTLTQIAIINNNTKAMLRLTDIVKNINEGSAQLQKSVANAELVAYISDTTSTASAQQNLVTFQDLFASKFTTFDNFIVTSQKVDNDSLSAKVEGYFIINDGEERKVLFAGDYRYDNESFILTYASFPQSPYLETLLNRLINQQTMQVDIPFVYEFVKNNYVNANRSVALCDILSSRVSFESCTNTNAIYDDGLIRIIFVFDGYKITAINSNKPDLTERLRTATSNVITTQNNIGVIVSELIKLAKEDNTQPAQSDELTGSSVDTNQFTIIGKFKQFLDVTPESINLNNGNYIVEFELFGINFITAVDITNNYKLFPIGIKKSESEVIRINNFSLNLINASLTEINQFKADPWAHIRKVDPAAYENAYPKNNN